MIEIFLFAILGCILGTIAGLIPGLHTNTISFLLVFVAIEQDTKIAVLIVAMTITHSFVEIIPSIFLGAPQSESFLAVLPGHYFLAKGKAMHAIKLAVYGSLFGTIFSILTLPLFGFAIKHFEEFLKQITPWILILSIFLAIFLEQKQKKHTIIVIAISSVLGIICLSLGTVQNPLFPLIAGFFGASGIVCSLQKKEKIAQQKESRFKVKTKNAIKTTIFSLLCAAMTSTIPSLGGAQATFLLSQLKGKITRSEYLMAIGGISTANQIFSFGFLFLTQKARTGSAVAIKEILQKEPQTIFAVIATALFAAGIGATMTLILSKKAAKIMMNTNYSAINKLVLAFLFAASFFSSGYLGIIAFVCATATGIIAITSGAKRTACMAFLMVPTILIYL